MQCLEFDECDVVQVLALVTGVLLEKQVVVLCPNLVSLFMELY